MRRRLLSLSLLAVLSMPVLADTLSMPDAPPPMGGGDQGQYFTPHLKSKKELLSLEMPVKGMNMQAVKKKFGSPLNKLPAVGKPPITRWVYKAFTVYFEYDYVIQAVLNPSSAPAQEGGLAPAPVSSAPRDDTAAPAATPPAMGNKAPVSSEPPQNEPVQPPAQ